MFGVKQCKSFFFDCIILEDVEKGDSSSPSNRVASPGRPDFSQRGGFSSLRQPDLLEVNADRTKYMVMSRDRNAGRGCSVKIDNSYIERVEEFKYLGTTLTHQILFRKKLRAD